MLDQNTDRMWYVIGAVLVGAANILIANGALPNMFASVTDNFQDVSDVALDGVAGINSSDINNSMNWVQGGIRGTDAEAYHTSYKIRSRMLPIATGTYSIRPEYANENMYKMVVHTFDSSGNHLERVNGSHTPDDFIIYNEGGYIQVEFAYFEERDGGFEAIEEDIYPSIVGESLNIILTKLNE